MSESPVLSLSGVRKSFERRQVLSGLNVDLFPGDFTLLLGANGSGKSTLLRLCSGLSRPDSGANWFSGKVEQSAHPWKPPPASLIGHIGHQLHLYAGLSVLENLRLTAALHGLNSDLPAYIKVWGLEEQADRRINELSRGLQARASLARALMHAPALVLLDEPTSALDDTSLEIMLAFIEQARSQCGCSILIATHDVGRLFPCATRIVILAAGVVAMDSRRVQRESGVALEVAREDCLKFYQHRNR